MLLKRQITYVVAVMMLICSGCKVGQIKYDNRVGGDTSIKNNTVAVQKEVKGFMCCLARGDEDEYMGYFSETAFSNEAFLGDSCAGYIKDPDRKSRAAIKEGARKFLGEFRREMITGSYATCGQNRLAGLEKQYGRKVLNNAVADGYVLSYLYPEEIRTLSDSEIGNKFLEKNLPSAGFFVVFVPAGEGVCYFFWLRDRNCWRIYHAGLVCM